MSLWLASHGPSGERLSWPDGGSTLAQPEVVVKAFSIITEVVAEVVKAKETDL